jgi:hypothetical protein
MLVLDGSRWRRTFFAADTGDGDGDGGDDTDNGSGSASSNAGVTFSPEQQAVVDRLVGEARKSGRKKALDEAEALAKKQREEAEAERLKENQEFQKLAEQRQKEIEELKAAIAERDARLRHHALERAFRREVGTQKLQFSTEQAAADAFALLDLKDVEIDEAGNAVAMAELVKDLQKTRPYLFQAPRGTTGGINSDEGRGNSGSLDPSADEARKAEIKQRFRVR